MDSFLEFWVKPVLDVPLVKFDSDRPGQRASAQNLVGHKEAELASFHAVVVGACW